MDTIELETFRQQLLQMQNDLRSTLTNDEQGRTVELDQSRMGRLSRMDALQNQQVALGAEETNGSQFTGHCWRTQKN